MILSPFQIDLVRVRCRLLLGLQLAIFCSSVSLLVGCNSLPDSGPTEAQINRSQRDPKKNTVGFGIVQVSPDLITLLESEAQPMFASLEAESGPTEHGKNDTAGPGDTLQVSIYEVGSALFSASATGIAASTVSGTNTMPATSTASNLPPLSVDGSGNINVPFAGQIHVSGMTTNEIAQAVQSRLKQKSQEPQVLVRIYSDIANSIMVYGNVRRPSRVPLTPNQERVLDVIALAGGQERQSDEDYVVQLTRHGKIAHVPLKTIENDPSQNIQMRPGDRIQVTYTPRSFTVFGASGHVTQNQFTTPTLTMAEAISRVGGPNDGRADPNAVYIFRFENADILRRLGMPVDGNAPTAPIVYQLDMMNPSSYFLAQKFIMHDHDLIYIANSSSNKFYKFFGLISAIVQPGITAAWMAK